MITDALLVQGIFFEMMLAITNIKWYHETADKVKRLEDSMKADYKNWMPKGMVLRALAGTCIKEQRGAYNENS